MSHRPQHRDAVALGLRRGSRGALLVLPAVTALALVVVFSREEGPPPAPLGTEAPPPAPPAAPAAAPPAKRSRTRTVPRQERTRKVAPAPTPQPEPPAVANDPPPEVPAAPTPQPEPPAVTNDPPPQVSAAPPPPPPLPPPEPPAPEVDTNAEAIARDLAAAKRAAVRACFERELKQTPTLTGTVVVELDLAPPNRVDEVRVTDDLQRPAFTRCVSAAMHDVRFAALEEELSVRVPYALRPGQK